MLSMDKAYSLEEINSWVKKTEDKTFIASPKMDGTCCNIHYINGKLFKASTRGSGTVGEDITKNVMEIKNVPKTVNYKKEFHVRGEVIMPLSVFKKYKDTNSNPRNLAAGSLKHKDTEESAKRGLVFYAYDVVNNSDLKTEEEEFQFLKDNGFTTVEYKVSKSEDLKEAYEEFLARRNEFDFEIDGVIFTANQISIQEKLGTNSHHPRYSIAWKIQGESATTALKDIQWSLSRTGVLTPVAILEPVNLSGANISKSSLHNAGFVISKNLSKNAIVEITRRGAVIPHVERVIEHGDEKFEIPTEFEGHKTFVEGDFLYIENLEENASVQIQRLIHFVTVLEADGFGDKIIAGLHKLGFLNSLDNFYTLTQEQLNQVDRMGDKTSTKLLEQIKSKKNLPLDIFLRSLGINELGRKVSKTLSNQFKTIDRVKTLTEEDLSLIDGIGPKIAKSVVSGIKENEELIDRLMEHIEITAEPEDIKKIDSKLYGVSFLFTGELETYKRKEAQEIVERLGGINATSANKELCYLVCGEEKTGKSSKQVKAEKLIASGCKLQIITEEEFLEIVKENE
jgi:DNA ligase (NAD+)